MWHIRLREWWKCSEFVIYLIICNFILILLIFQGIQALFMVKLLYWKSSWEVTVACGTDSCMVQSKISWPTRFCCLYCVFAPANAPSFQVSAMKNVMLTSQQRLHEKWIHTNKTSCQHLYKWLNRILTSQCKIQVQSESFPSLMLLCNW